MKSFKLVDLRSIAEINKFGKILGSKNIPVERFLELTRDRKIKNKNIIVYCNSGNRSRRAAFIANMNGYNCKDLGGFKYF